MPSSVDCLLCLVRQSLDAARFASDDPAMHQKVVRDVMQLVLDEPADVIPPVIGQKIHRLIRQRTGNPDPYIEGKRRSNEALLEMFDTLHNEVFSSDNPFETAIRFAIAGNTIDFALGKPSPDIVERAFAEARVRPINGNVALFRQKFDAAKSILYLTDNAGEIVCDRLFIELLRKERPECNLTVAVRGRPILNDALREDAETVGLTKLVPVIDNGNDALGTMLEQCSEEFLQYFQSVDLVISKGLANYETLIENTGPIVPRDIVYLFKSKCPFISHFAGTQVGDLVVVCPNAN